MFCLVWGTSKRPFLNAPLSLNKLCFILLDNLLNDSLLYNVSYFSIAEINWNDKKQTSVSLILFYSPSCYSFTAEKMQENYEVGGIAGKVLKAILI